MGVLDKHGRIDPKHKEEFLKLRFDPGHSISAAADYAKENLRQLDADIIDRSPAAMARYGYIAHHEGVGGARGFLRGTLTVGNKAWDGNLTPAQKRRYLAKNGNNRNLAYRDRMADYVNENIDIRRYMGNSNGVVVPETRALFRKR